MCSHLCPLKLLMMLAESPPEDCKLTAPFHKKPNPPPPRKGKNESELHRSTSLCYLDGKLSLV